MSALSGIKVLEFGKVYNGPYCGLILAQLGAEVIKIEPLAGEQLRYRSTETVETHEFTMLNSNKRSLAIDLKSPAGREVVLDLVRHVDVVVENFAPGAMDRLGFGPRALISMNPRLIYASGKGYGNSGPYAGMAAMDITVQAMSGAVSVTGEKDGPPMKSGVGFVDMSGGIHLYAAIATALYERERTGRGQVVEVSMHDTVYPMLASSLGALHNPSTRQLPERTGNRHSGLAVSPYGIYRTSDGWLAIISISDRHFEGITACMGRGDLLEDSRFADGRSRATHGEVLDREIEEWTSARSRDDLVRMLQSEGVPCAPVRTLREIDADPHLIDRGMIGYVDHPQKGRVPVPGCAVRLQSSPCEPLRAAPALGADSGDVVKEMCGYSDDRIADLYRSGVIGGR